MNAVHRTGGQTEGASCAVFDNHLVQMLKRPDDGINRAGGNTEGAADAAIFVNPGNLQWPFFAACLIKRCYGCAGESGEFFDTCAAPGRTTIDGCLP